MNIVRHDINSMLDNYDDKCNDQSEFRNKHKTKRQLVLVVLVKYFDRASLGTKPSYTIV